MSFTSPTGNEYPSASYFSSCDRIWTTLMGSLVAGAPAFVQNVSGAENGLADAPGTVVSAAPDTGAIAARVTAATHASTRPLAPRRCTRTTLEAGSGQSPSRASEVR